MVTRLYYHKIQNNRYVTTPLMVRFSIATIRTLSFLNYPPYKQEFELRCLNQIGIVNFGTKKQKQNIKNAKAVLQNLYIGGTENVPAATIYRTCYGPSELKLWQFLSNFKNKK
ncbi:hypothetical protein BpHYR1_038847 [Brachionus plicatilis]|uniref:Uncharacterized protein n=1 Tax=Brachionus plicatilis TaxID=10195 RepID=A0A3M7QGW9_BRAPC|nr:hypothetical protein BpHYR1_038847 [Brachionus plicatilis]